MTCNTCGTENENGTKYCSSCGSLLNASSDDSNTSPENATNSEPIHVTPVANVVPSTKENKHATEVLIGGIIAASIFILGVFLPYAKIAFAEISLIQGGIASDAGIALLLGLLSLGASVTKRPVTILITGVINMGFVALKAATFSSQAKGATLFGVNLVRYSIGYYCLWAGAGLLIVVGIYGIIRRVNGSKPTTR